MCVWPQGQTLCSPCSMGLDSANCHSFLKLFSSLKCCKWRYKFTSRSLQIRPCTRRMWSCLAFCLVNVALQYQQSKQGFSSAWAVFMCRVKFWADVDTLSKIIHGKRNGLFQCCCLTCRNITCLYPLVTIWAFHSIFCCTASLLMLKEMAFAKTLPTSRTRSRIRYLLHRRY